MGERIGVNTDEFGHLDLLIDQCRRIEQLAQAHVLLGQGGKLLHAALHQQRFGLEFFVLGDQLGTTAKLAGDALPQLLRQVGDLIGLHQHQPHLAAYRFEQGKARIDHHQGDRQHNQHEQAHAQRRALGEKRFNRPLLVDDDSRGHSYGNAPACLWIDGK
ncbi:hypothetical protein D3C72_1853820 [compost metagenome]